MKQYLLLFSLILTVFISEKSFGQGQYSMTHIAIAPQNKKIILSEIWRNSREDYRGYVKNSKLYEFPLDCNNSKDLILCDNYEWSKDGRFFTGFKSKSWYDSEIYLYESTGKLIDKIKNGYTYSFVLPEFHVFYRQHDTLSKKRICQLVQYDYKNKSETIIYSFGEDYTFYSPEDHDGFGFPKPLDYYWGGLRGVIYKITKTDHENFTGNIMEYETLTFVISTKDKKLKYLIQGSHTDKKPLPEDKILKSSR
jgi:hypothetical protein